MFEYLFFLYLVGKRLFSRVFEAIQRGIETGEVGWLCSCMNMGWIKVENPGVLYFLIL